MTKTQQSREVQGRDCPLSRPTPELRPTQELRLGELEELILLAITGLQEKAYGVAIGKRLQEAGRTILVGALYTTLERMEAKGLIESSQAPATPERGGRAKTYYSVTDQGHKSLQAVEVVRRHLRNYLHEYSDISLQTVGIDAPHERAGSVTADMDGVLNKKHAARTGDQGQSTPKPEETKKPEQPVPRSARPPVPIQPPVPVKNTSKETTPAPRPAFPSLYDTF